MTPVMRALALAPVPDGPFCIGKLVDLGVPATSLVALDQSLLVSRESNIDDMGVSGELWFLDAGLRAELSGEAAEGSPPVAGNGNAAMIKESPPGRLLEGLNSDEVVVASSPL